MEQVKFVYRFTPELLQVELIYEVKGSVLIFGEVNVPSSVALPLLRSLFVCSLLLQCHCCRSTCPLFRLPSCHWMQELTVWSLTNWTLSHPITDLLTASSITLHCLTHSHFTATELNSAFSRISQLEYWHGHLSANF